MQRWLNPRAFLHFKGVPNATYLTGQNLYWYRHTLNGSFELNSGVAARPTGNRSNHTPNDPKYPPPVRRHPVLHPEYSTETHPLLAEMQNREENVDMVFDYESDQESINVALVNNHNHNKSSSSRKRPLDLNKSPSSRKKRKICTGGDDPKYPPVAAQIDTIESMWRNNCRNMTYHDCLMMELRQWIVVNQKHPALHKKGLLEFIMYGDIQYSWLKRWAMLKDIHKGNDEIGQLWHWMRRIRVNDDSESDAEDEQEEEATQNEKEESGVEKEEKE
eukprot:824206_1